MRKSAKFNRPVWWALFVFVWNAAHNAAADEVDFAHDVVPILKTHCVKCHAGLQQEGDFSFNTREQMLAGGSSGPAIVAGEHANSELFRRIVSVDDGYRMPPEGQSLTEAQTTVISQWIDQGANWEPGFSFAPRSSYEPPLRPRRPELPAATAGRDHPLDRILDADLSTRGQLPLTSVSDDVFLRRVTLDLVGLLPTPEQREAFLSDPNPDKRNLLIDRLLQDEIAYADHWLTFWNDLLRNDYTGTGFITGGRTQITTWLYDALLRNMPYDQMARELIAPPTPDSAGFINGIRWRGEVSAGQTVEIQFAQSVGQSFLGINLKCASCHDSFVDRWTLNEAFGLAAIYSERPLEIHRCDKPLGTMAEPNWLFPELGTVDRTADKNTRLQQLAQLLTHPENGRFTRTIVNRLWHRLMGRGIVHPTDSMQTEPWNADLLDYLAVRLADQKYDLKQTLRLIVTSAAYQSAVERVDESASSATYAYAGPRGKRLTAEQFLDAVWQLTGTAPVNMDAQVQRYRPGHETLATKPLQAQWIWNRTDATQAAGGESLAFRKVWTVREMPQNAFAIISCDNEFRCYLNGRLVGAGTQWDAPTLIPLPDLVVGENELLIVGRNGGDAPNPAGLWCEVRYQSSDKLTIGFGTDESWQWTTRLPRDSGGYEQAPNDWQDAAILNHSGVWAPHVTPQAQYLLTQASNGEVSMIRASLVKSDFLMRSLGRPNRDQIVSVRPSEMTTLEAIDLSIGETLDRYLQGGAERLAQKPWQSPADFVRWVYQHALSREPNADELQILTSDLSLPLQPTAAADVLWAVIMLPEFQINR
ncbi:MAG: DUF1549 domain-containing protein [Pirellulaceae bacterium]|nr:DUF1549 domain-containing protein [Pirellulaceae bacterium]